MRKYVYCCDACEHVFGDVAHITIEVKHMGLAVPPSRDRATWQLQPVIHNVIVQFCNTSCMVAWFETKGIYPEQTAVVTFE